MNINTSTPKTAIMMFEMFTWYGVPGNNVKLNATDIKLNGIDKICHIKPGRSMTS